MFRLLAALLVLAVAGLAATVRLYLKDGTYHLVREYQVESDRVRFYSVERSEWEEVPLSLIDLKRTEAEIKEKQEALREEAAALSAEDRAEQEHQREISRVPQEKGVYLVDGQQLRPLPQAEVQVVSNKRRSVLRVLVPVPVVAGKSTAEIDGETSPNLVATDHPEFYIRLWAEERFGIIRLTRQKGTRLVEKWSIIPVTKEIVEEHEEIEIFRRQVGDGLYKIWPEKPLEPGEYAVVEFTPGKGNIQVWDFSYNSAGAPAKK